MIKKTFLCLNFIIISSSVAFANPTHEEWIYTYHVHGDSGMSCDQTPAEAVEAANAAQDAACEALNAEPRHEDCHIEGSDLDPPQPQRGDTDQKSEWSIRIGDNGFPEICKAHGATVGPGICKCKVLEPGVEEPEPL